MAALGNRYSTITGVYRVVVVFFFLNKDLYLNFIMVVLVVKNLPANAGDSQETRVQSLGWEDPLEEEMAIHSSILGEFHGQRSLAGYSP